jgi:hypothetical protein
MGSMKIVRDGKVAVAVSHGFGAGWSTWEDVDATDARFNKLFLEGNLKEVEKLCKELGFYAGGIEDVEIEWVEEGTKFIIEEYDGAETLITEQNINWGVA